MADKKTRASGSQARARKRGVTYRPEFTYEGVRGRVFRPEYLYAIALKTGRAKDLAKVEALQEQAKLDPELLSRILTHHGIRREKP